MTNALATRPLWVDDALGCIEACRAMGAIISSRVGSAGARSMRYGSAYELVLEQAWVFEPLSLPEGVSPGTPKHCYWNAGILSGRRYRTCAFVEGYGTRILPTIPHAWCAVSATGRLVDPTWVEPGSAYLGVPFDPRWVRAQQRARKHSLSILDDFENGFPYLRNGLPAESLHADFADRSAKAHAWPIEAFLAAHTPLTGVDGSGMVESKNAHA